MKSAQSVREELAVAGTVQVLVVLSIEEQLEGEGETPRRPGGRREGWGRGWEKGKEEERGRGEERTGKGRGGEWRGREGMREEEGTREQGRGGEGSGGGEDRGPLL